MCALLFYAFTTIVPKSPPTDAIGIGNSIVSVLLILLPLVLVCVMLAALRTSSRDSSVVDGSVQVDVAVLLDGRAEEVVTFALLLLLLKLLLFRRLLWSSRWSQMRWKCGRRLRSLSDSSEKAAADSRNCPGKSSNNNNTVVVVVVALLIFLEIRAGSSLGRLEKKKTERMALARYENNDKSERHLVQTQTTQTSRLYKNNTKNKTSRRRPANRKNNNVRTGQRLLSN
jgi:hypothetical protein